MVSLGGLCTSFKFHSSSREPRDYLACSMYTDRQMHAHTHSQTHLHKRLPHSSVSTPAFPTCPYVFALHPQLSQPLEVLMRRPEDTCHFLGFPQTPKSTPGFSEACVLPVPCTLCPGSGSRSGPLSPQTFVLQSFLSSHSVFPPYLSRSVVSLIPKRASGSLSALCPQHPCQWLNLIVPSPDFSHL